MIKAGIFDAGGVLQTYDIETPIFNDIINALQVSKDTFLNAWYTHSKPFSQGKISENEFWKKIVQDTGSLMQIPNKSLLMNAYRENFTINKEMVYLLKRLKNQGLQLAILSNTIFPHAEFNKTHGLYDLFDIKILSNETGLSKPDPDIYKLTLKKLDVSPEETFFVDDMEKNIEIAKQLRIHAILFHSPNQLKKELEKFNL